MLSAMCQKVTLSIALETSRKSVSYFYCSIHAHVYYLHYFKNLNVTKNPIPADMELFVLRKFVSHSKKKSLLVFFIITDCRETAERIN